MADKFKIVAKFQDRNQPSINTEADGLYLAVCEVAHFARQFAALKMITIYDPDGSRHCYNGQGRYYFTLPPMESQS